jgi:DNA-binding protein Fis
LIPDSLPKTRFLRSWFDFCHVDQIWVALIPTNTAFSGEFAHSRWQPVMKHVTLIVDSAASPGPTDRFASIIPSHRVPQSVEANACLSIEVRLSPARAQLLVDLLLELEREEQLGSGIEELIATLLRNQLKDSDHLTGELFDKVISNVEKVVIQHAYENCSRVQTRTAEHLGIDRNTLHKKLRRYNLLK